MLFLLSVSLLAASAAESPVTLECPKLIETNQSVTQLPSSWRARKSHWKNQFERIQVYASEPVKPPFALLKLEPNGEINIDGKASIWVACIYSHTNFELISEVKAAKKCRVAGQKVICYAK
jgi:hypothetical protein